MMKNITLLTSVLQRDKKEKFYAAESVARASIRHTY